MATKTEPRRWMAFTQSKQPCAPCTGCTEKNLNFRASFMPARATFIHLRCGPGHWSGWNGLEKLNRFVFDLHFAHFPGHHGFVLLVLFAIHLEFVAHVIGVLVFPILAGIGVGKFGGLSLQE